MENLLIIFIVVIGIAVVLQAGVLIAMFTSVKKTAERVNDLGADLQKRLAPILDSSQAILIDNRPKIYEITDNLVETSMVLRDQSSRLQVTMNDVLDRTRLQVIRADELATRTMDRVEDTTELVHETVIAPIKQVSALVAGLTAGFSTFFGGRTRQPERTPEDEEMFI
jgi:hypothetical protein